MKINRKKIYYKYDGHCAYCGVEIQFYDMQVDHIIAKSRSYNADRESNLNPSCQKCNLFKCVLDIEQFRYELSQQVKRLQNRNAQFNRALRYNQITITEQPITFYFEKVHET